MPSILSANTLNLRQLAIFRSCSKLMNLFAAMSFILLQVEARRFLLILSKSQNKIQYSPLPTFEEAVASSQLEATQPPQAIDLITETEIAQPRSMTSWSEGTLAHILFVYDAATQAIYKYDINVGGSNGFGTIIGTDDSTTLSVSNKLEIVSSIQVSTMTVDSQQNLYILKQSTNELIKIAPGILNNYASTATVLHAASNSLSGNTGMIESPTSMAVDTLYLYWSNDAKSPGTGVIIGKAPMKLGSAYGVAGNIDQSSGVCVSPTLAFYTGPKTLYATAKNNTDITGVTSVIHNSDFSNAEGCIYDISTGAIYVADSGNSMVYELPGKFTKMREVKTLTPVAMSDGASDVVLVASSSSGVGRYYSQSNFYVFNLVLGLSLLSIISL